VFSGLLVCIILVKFGSVLLKSSDNASVEDLHVLLIVLRENIDFHCLAINTIQFVQVVKLLLLACYFEIFKAPQHNFVDRALVKIILFLLSFGFNKVQTYCMEVLMN
jgi:hypothetical protein